MGNTSTDPAVELHISAEKTRLLYINQARSYRLSLVTAGVPVGLAYQNDLLIAGLVWFGLFFFIASMRYLLTRRYLATQPSPAESPRWANYYSIGAAVAGTLWGLGALLLAMYSPPLFQLITLFLVYGLVAAAVPLLGAHRPAMLAFQLPTLTPLTLWSLFNTPDIKLLLAYTLVLYLSGIRISQGQLQTYVEKSHRLRLENQRLIEQLNKSNDQLQASNQELTQLSHRDALTGLANRRRYEEQLAQEWRRAAREGTCTAMLVVDIDYFKRYNDALGHEAGDRCLQEFAAVLAAATQRPGDLVARYGGEEFVVLLPHTDLAGAETLALVLHQRLADAKLPHPNSPLGPWLTASLGVGSLPAKDHSASDLFNAADEALYAAKSAGRNQVQVHRPDGPPEAEIQTAPTVAISAPE